MALLSRWTVLLTDSADRVFAKDASGISGLLREGGGRAIPLHTAGSAADRPALEFNFWTARMNIVGVDIGVYPFLVPLRPVAGSLMGDWSPPPHDYVQHVARRVTPYLAERRLGADTAKAGCSSVLRSWAVSSSWMTSSPPARRCASRWN